MSDVQTLARKSRLWTMLPWLVSIGSLCFAILLAEGVFRLLGYARVVQFDYVPQLGWVHEVNQSTETIGGQPVHINSAGFRGPEVSERAMPGTLRIMLVGDSFTFGYGVADDSTLSMQMQRELAHAPGTCPRVEIINAGVNGYDTDQEVLFVQRLGLQYRPDVVIVGFNPNDIVSAVEGRTMLSRPKLKRLLTRSAMYQFLAPRLKAVMFHKQGVAYSREIDALIAGDSSSAWRVNRVRSRLVSLDSIGRVHGFRTVLAIFPFSEHVYGSAKGPWPPAQLASLDKDGGMPVVDPLPALRRAAVNREPLFLDEPTHHPNPTALAVVSHELATFLRRRGIVPGCAP